MERALLIVRLRERRREIEDTMLARVFAVTTLGRNEDPEYLHGLRHAVTAAVDYALAAIELGGERAPPIPTALLGQARLAARYGVGLDTVLRRYVAGYATLVDFMLEEADRETARRGIAMQPVFHGQTNWLELLISSVADEYNREAANRPLAGEERRLARVRRMLAGELLDAGDLAYHLKGWHVGLVAAGLEVGQLQTLADRLDRLLLAVRPHDEAVWAWLGGRSRVDSETIADRAERALPVGSLIALGEPAAGLSGWRLTHHQAKSAAPFADHGMTKVIRYSTVGIVASAIKDEILLKSLRQLYLDPLSEERDGGSALRDALRAYLAAGQRVTSAAAALHLSRQTVTARLRVAEERIGRRLDTCATELDIALRVEQVTAGSERSTAHAAP